VSPALLTELARVFAIEAQHARRAEAAYLALVARALRVSADAERELPVPTERPGSAHAEERAESERAERETVRPPSHTDGSLSPASGLVKVLGSVRSRDRNIAG